MSALRTCTADLSDAHGDRLLPCSLPWRAFGGESSFAGPVATVRCQDDNGLLRPLLSTPGNGRVLVVDGQGSVATALVGDGLAGLALANGWRALVVHGAVRDVAGLRALPIGVLALGTNPRRGAADGVGELDVAVTFGGITFRPGCIVHADEDGLLVDTGPVLADESAPNGQQ